MIMLEIAAVVVFGFYVGKAVLEKRAIQAQIATLELDISKLEHEKDSLGALIEYAKTDSFVQKEAREKLNLTAQGESVVVIPEIDSGTSVAVEESSVKAHNGSILGESNVKIWWEYFFDYSELSSQSNAQESQ